MLSRFFEWLRTPPVSPTQEQHLQQLLEGLCSTEGFAFERASHTLSNIALNRYADFSADYTILVLNALAEKEGLREIDWVLRQVEFLSKPSLASNATPQVRAAAKQCAHRLRERTEAGYAAKTLLHSAEPPAAPEKELLRPAQGSEPTQQATLLRPSPTEVSPD